MEKIKNIYTSLLVFVILLTSCQDTLEEIPRDFVSPNNFFNNPTEAKAAVYSLYNTLANGDAYNISLWWLNTFATPNTVPMTNVDAQVMGNFNYDALHPNLDYYRGAFKAILRSNLILEKVPNILMDPTERNALLGEAKFMRGLHYFNMVRLFGDVPLMTSSTILLNEARNNPRVNKEDIYNLIIEDLQFASEWLPITYPSSEVGRATMDAAKTVLSLVHLTRKEFKEARDISKEIIDAGNYSLVADYRHLYDPAFKNNEEHILSAQYLLFRVGSWFDSWMSPPGSNGCGFADGQLSVNPEWYEQYPETYRKEISMMTTYVTTQGNLINYDRPYIKKFHAWGPEIYCYGNDLNFPIFRFAEVLLIFAEAENEVNGPSLAAYETINRVRKRARTYPDGSEAVDELPDLAGLSQAEFREAVYEEREMELCFEGKSWFDLVRTDRLVSVNQAAGRSNVSETHLVYPIPQFAMDQNRGLIQNPGY